MKKILWIDEMPMIGRMYSHLISDFGLPYEIDSRNSYESTDYKGNYELIILDFDSRRFNGLELFTKIAKNDDIPIIITSRMKEGLPYPEMNEYLNRKTNHIIIDKPIPIVNNVTFNYFIEAVDLIFELNPDKKLIITPELQIFERDIKIINQSLLEIVAKNRKTLDALSPYQFEDLISELFQREQYTINKKPRTRDGGMDLIAYKLDDFGKLVFAVECKKYSKSNKVGRPAIQKFLGAISQENVTGGIFITTSYFTKDAFEFIQPISNKIFLNDFDDLNNWLNKYK